MKFSTDEQGSQDGSLFRRKRRSENAATAKPVTPKLSVRCVTRSACTVVSDGMWTARRSRGGDGDWCQNRIVEERSESRRLTEVSGRGTRIQTGTRFECR